MNPPNPALNLCRIVKDEAALKLDPRHVATLMRLAREALSTWIRTPNPTRTDGYMNTSSGELVL
jgi:hypothetical protein